MARTPKRFCLVTPSAAAYLWRISDARLRRLALDGKLPYRTLRNWGGKPSRAYDFDTCRERWGEPDADRLDLLLRLTSYQLGREDAVIWEILAPRPVVLDESGDLAFSMED